MAPPVRMGDFAQGPTRAPVFSNPKKKHGLKPDVSNEMENVFHDREGVCPMDAMPKLAEV
jgi:hypothetical protein